MKQYLCPADRKLACSWEGNAEDILEHFQQEHDFLLFFDDSFTVDLSVDSENRLFFLDEEIYLLQTKISNNKLIIQLRYLGPHVLAREINYNIEFRVKGERYRNNIIVNNQKGIELDLESLRHFKGNVEVLSCTLNVTKHFSNLSISSDDIEYDNGEHKKDQTTKSINTSPNESTDIPLPVDDDKEEQFMESIDSQKMRRTKKCFRSNTLTLEELMNKSPVKRTKSTISLGSIQECSSTSDCSNCGKFLIPPIYLCPCHQNFCKSCQSVKCQHCYKQVTTERNIELEEKYKRFLFPCKNQKLGCPDKILYDKLIDHEIHCTFCLYRCPSEECHFESPFKGMVKHLKLIHGSIKISDSFIIAFQNFNEIFVVSEERGIFHCCVRYTNDTVEWRAKFCGPKERKFFCELKFKEGKHEPFLLNQQDNVYNIELTLQFLKKKKLKPKNAVLVLTY